MARKPLQARSILSTTRMLDAAELIFAEGGDNALTVEAVVKRAETSVGNFYGRFGDRDGLLQAMHDRFLERLGVAGQAAVSLSGREKTLGRAINVFIKQAFATFHEHRNSARFFILHRSLDQGMRAQGIQANAMLAGMFTTLVLGYSNEITHNCPKIAADVAYRLTFAAVMQQVMFDNHEVSGVSIANRTLVREVTHCLVTYLKSPTKTA
ncbi:MAG: TetR/AcrR family transcriptional regulator [Planctomycetota bacterium]|nr:TetR/AcrR family transcriptional regulator [Planctomycetota bacterium]